MVQPTANSAGPAGDISVREWICWEGEGPMEPTTTLVLTAPSNTFLDVRLLLPTPQTPLSELPLPNTGGPLNRLDWAFSGVSETLPPLVMPQMQLAAAHTQVPPLVPVEYGRLYDPNATGPWGSGAMTVPRKRWRHVIDSRCVAPDQKPAQDEGEMYPVAGRPEACLEIGRMERERGSGVSVGYQELWVTVEPRLVGTETGRHGVVLSLDMPERQARGIVVRVAQYCQALLMINGQIDLERWEHFVGAQGTMGEWQRVAKLGSRFLPCAWTFEDGKAMLDNVAVGSTLQDGEMMWQVQERFTW